MLTVIPLGADAALVLRGGDGPHGGAVVLAQARPSLTGSGVSATSSVINRLGHKDETPARRLAEVVAAATGGAVSCACGIHIEGAAVATRRRMRFCRMYSASMERSPGHPVRLGCRPVGDGALFKK
nr:hypothetical protein [uncultured Sutterella sp.]